MVHTKGPWELQGSRIVAPNVPNTFGLTLEQFRECFDHEPEPTLVVDLTGAMGGEDSQADARLLAAAPDLLAACEAISDAFVAGDIVWKHKRQADSDPYHPANTKLCAALARVRDESCEP